MSLKDIILGPVMTEKSFKDQEKGLYTFWVKVEATKTQIKSSVESFFGVKVIKVRTAIKGGEKKRDWRRGKSYYQTKKKKAYVKIAPDQKIELVKGK